MLKKIKLINILFLTLAGIINAIGVTLFLMPLNLFDSGISGTSILFDKLTPPYLTLSIFLIILNFPLYLFGYKKIGFQFVIYSLYAICIYSLFSFLITKVIPFDFSNGSPICNNDILLAAIFGGLISGIGSGMVIRFGGAIDGVEVLAVLFAKKLSITVGTFVMIYNILLYTIVAIVFKSWTIPLYSIIAYAMGIKTVDFIVEGLDKAKASFIITEKKEEVAKVLSNEMGRGITIINAQGYYSNKEKAMIYCVVNRFEITKLKRLVQSVDENAFVTISEVSDTIGTKIKFKLKKKDKTL